jgi:type I restriction enzyme S subunit
VNPVLRFKEFEDDYLVGCINDVTASLNSGVSVNSYDFPVNSADEYGVLKTSCISNGIFNYSENKKVIESDIDRAKNSVKQGTIIVSRMNTPALVGEVGYIDQSFTNLFVPDRLWVLNCKKGNNAKWLTYCLISQRVKTAIKSRATGTSATMKNISKPSFLNVKTSIPVQEEQQKNADFISAVDKKITLLKKKHALLKQYKKGVLQKLFSQDIRFKDESGNDFPNWKNKVVGDFMLESRIKGNSGLTAKKITVKLWGKGVFEKNASILGSENTQYYTRKAGQFLYSKLDFLNCAFGIIPDFLDDFETTVDLPCFDIADGINKYLILEFIKQKRFYKKFGDMADGSRKAKRIHAKDFLSFPINLPCEQEQNKITDFLQALDKKRGLVSQQIEQTQTFKKGLLQQMFV